MRLLLDTHVALWSIGSSHRLPSPIVATLADPENEVFVSIVSLWEIAIKNAPGRLVRMPYSTAIAAARFEEFHYDILPLKVSHAAFAETLAMPHSDPFDRMLLAQAEVETLQFVTHDGALRSYGQKIMGF